MTHRNLASYLYNINHKKLRSVDYSRLGKLVKLYPESVIFDGLEFLIDNLENVKSHPDVISLLQWKLSVLTNKNNAKDALNKINMGTL